MTISIDKSLYDNHYKKYDPNFKISKEEKEKIEKENIEMEEKYKKSIVRQV